MASPALGEAREKVSDSFLPKTTPFLLLIWAEVPFRLSALIEKYLWFQSQIEQLQRLQTDTNWQKILAIPYILFMLIHQYKLTKITYVNY